ncbi:MAG TPA: ATP-binding protein [Syntrophales bacterium]|nr:ATP-binding protein [Syntrophales bacterium]
MLPVKFDLRLRKESDREGLVRKITPLCLAFLLLLSSSGLASLPKESKRVLLLYSEEKADPAHELTDQGIRAVFRSNQLFNVQLYTEYLDLTRFSGPDNTHAVAEYLRRKYAVSKIDVIISVYPAALDFLMREEVFYGVPLVVCEIFRPFAESLDRSPWRSFTTGVVVESNIADLLDGVFRMKPGTKRVALVAGTSGNDARSEMIFRNALKPYAGKIELIDLAKMPMQEILARVGSLPPDTVVLYSTIFRDGAGRSFAPREALSLVSRAANAPVFGLYEPQLGFGIVGGRLVGFELQGRESAALALRIMGGESPASIPFAGEQAYINAYDWRELERWGISETVLLPGSIVKFKPPSIWEDHWPVILGGIFFMVMEALLIVSLFVNFRKIKLSDARIRKAKDEYRELAGRLLTAQETERRRLARELHDDLSQRLAALAIEAGFLERESPSLSQAAAAKVQEIREGLVNLSGNVHDISRHLHPSILEDLGLADAIRSECDGLARREPIEVHFESRDCPPRIPLHIGLCLYRITQESLRNIVKHARATKVDVSLTGGKEIIHLLIKDNGRGFNPDHVFDERGLGLISMRERVRLIQAEMIIRSQPGQGTAIEIQAPLWEVADRLAVQSEEPL